MDHWKSLHRFTLQLFALKKRTIDVLTKIYGLDIANKDWTRLLLRFIPLSMLKSTAASNDKFIRHQLSFDKKKVTVMPRRNLQGLEEIVQSIWKVPFNSSLKKEDVVCVKYMMQQMNEKVAPFKWYNHAPFGHMHKMLKRNCN